MLFFFELFLFVLVMLTLALGEFVSRGLALTLWLVVAAFTFVGYLLARQTLRSIAAGESGLPGATAPEAPPAGSSPSDPTTRNPAQPGQPPHVAAEIDPELDGPAYARQHDAAIATEALTPLDARWARTLLYNWRRTNVLLLLGAVAVGGWYWLAG